LIASLIGVDESIESTPAFFSAWIADGAVIPKI